MNRERWRIFFTDSISNLRNFFYDPFILLSSTFLFSIFFSSILSLDYAFAGFIVLLALIFFVYAFIYLEKETRQTFTLVGVVLIVFSIGILRFEIKDRHVFHADIESGVGQTITLEGIVVEEPTYKGKFREYIFKTNDEKILVRGEIYPEFRYGDKLKFSGKLEKPNSFIDERGQMFDYPEYLAKYDVYLVMSFAKGEFIEGGHGNWLKSKLLTFKGQFVDVIEKHITEPASSLLAGILLGIEDSMGKDLEDAFRVTGIIHIVVLSGYNITLVVDAIYWILSRSRFLSRKTILWLESLGIFLFVLMVGGAPPVVRAGLMAMLVLLARGTGRTYLIARALVITAVVMVLWNPKVLVFDTGFQLSFLATIAIVWISPIVLSKLSWITEKFGVRNILADTVATQVFVLPLLLYKIGMLSVISVLTNLLVLPAVPLTMFFGFLTGALGLFFSWAAFPFAVLSQILLNYILKVVETLSNVPFAAISIPYFPVYFMLTTYSLYAYIFYKLRLSKTLNTFK